MNKLLPIVLTLMCFGFSQEYEDVIYLKDGSVIYGVIVEIKPGEYYTIQSGENIFVYEEEEIDVIRKQLVYEQIFIEASNEDINDKTWSFGVGLYPRTSSLMSMAKDFRLGAHSSIFISNAWFIAPQFNLGYSYRQNYENNGVFFNISSGTYYDYGADDWESQSLLSIGYQFRNKKGKPVFWTLGIFSHSYTYYDYYYEEERRPTDLGPIISWETRF